MALPASVFRPILEPLNQTREVSDGFFVGPFALFGTRQFRVAQNAGLTVAAGPGDQRRGTRGKQIDPIKRTILFVEADHAALYPVFAHVPAIQIKVERGLQFTGVRASAGKLALAPARQEFLVNREQTPPRAKDAFGVGLEVGAPGDQVEAWHVGTMAVEQQDFLEAVVSQRFCDVEDVMDEMFVVIVNG